MHTRLLSTIVAMLPVVAAASQTSNTVSSLGVSWPNASGAGTPVLSAEVYFPAQVVAGQAIVAPKQGGWPVVVFAHGYGLLGSAYGAIADHLAEAGFVTVLLDTAQWNYLELEFDLRATFAALAAANAQPSGFFFGAFDMQRVGLMGHSMGGSVLGYVLQELPGGTQNNPGYRCGLAVTPVNPGPVASAVHVPFGIVSGLGDVVTPPDLHAEPFYAALAPEQGLKFHYALTDSADHMNLVGLFPGPQSLFDRTKRIAAGFFGHFLADDHSGLEPVIGIDGCSEPDLYQLSTETATPQIWVDRALQVGTLTRISVSSEGGLTGVLAAATLAATPLPTLIGNLLLDPVTAFTLDGAFIVGERFDVYVQVPDGTALVGMGFALQAAGTTVVAPFLLGSALDLMIQP